MSDINVQTFSGKVNITSNLLVGTSHFFVDTTNNRVGITTASPSASLDVNGDVNVGTNITFGGVLTGNGSGLTSVNSDSGLWAGAGTGSVYLSTSTDKVGIGTTNPTRRLDVVGGPTKSDGFILGTSNNIYYPGCIYTDSNWGMLFRGAVSSPGIADFVFNDYAGSNMMVIKNGDVGIGTTSPSRKFHVVSGVGDTSTNWISGVFGGSGDYPRVVMGSLSTYACVGSHNSALNGWADLYLNNPTNPVVVKTTGKVGIGTTSPLAKLEVHNSGTAASFGDLVADFTGSWIRIGDARSSRTFTGGSGIKFHDGGVAHYSVGQLDGKFKISVSSGDGNSLFPSGYTEGITVNTSGNVGIGTSDPQSLLQVPRPAVAYDKVIQLGTQTTYADGDLYSLGFGGNALMGIGLATGTRSVFGRQGMATHIPNTETWGIYTNSWTKLINVDGSTRRVYFGHTDKFNLFYAPDNWSYSTTSTSETNLWTFTVSIPQDGYLIVSSNGHWSNDTANKWVYAKIGVDSADPADTSGFYDSFTGGGASTNGGDFHGYKDSSVSWQDFNWSGTLKVSAGTRTICMRVKVSGGTFSLNGAAVNMLYIPKNYF